MVPFRQIYGISELMGLHFDEMVQIPAYKRIHAVNRSKRKVQQVIEMLCRQNTILHIFFRERSHLFVQLQHDWIMFLYYLIHFCRFLIRSGHNFRLHCFRYEYLVFSRLDLIEKSYCCNFLFRSIIRK